jgi:hypothetical protein
MTTPAIPSRTPTNAFAAPFIPASITALSENRPSTSSLQGIISSHHPPPMSHPASIIPGERMTMPNILFPDEQPFHPVSGIGIRKLMNEDQYLQSKVENILREWITICYTPVAQRDPQNALACIVQMVLT